MLSRTLAACKDFNWNVLRIAKGSVTFLQYGSFEQAAFPALLKSLKVSEDCNPRRIDYRKRSNPPILHRKELLLLPDDVRLPQFRALTRAAEERGLFEEPHKIGTRLAWERRVAEAGLCIMGQSLVPAGEDQVEISRHKTAIVRRDLSEPMQIMLRLGIVTKERTVFDYGSGRERM